MRYLVASEAEQHLEQRQIALGDRLEEPALLEELLVLGMAHEWQVRVQDQREVPSRCSCTRLG